MIEYDEITAFHYAAYRPKLHDKILNGCLTDHPFSYGLDIGCGTGNSSIALANFCNTVVGVDPSEDMIAKAITHTNVRYQHLSNARFDFDSNSFDIITLAGSLWYAKSQQLLDEITRVADTNATLLVYDFEVFLKDVLIRLGYQPPKQSVSSYNHDEDFSNLDTSKISQIEKQSEKHEFQITVNNLAHLILSVKEQRTSLNKILKTDSVFDAIVENLKNNNGSESFKLRANSYYTLYSVT